MCQGQLISGNMMALTEIFLLIDLFWGIYMSIHLSTRYAPGFVYTYQSRSIASINR